MPHAMPKARGHAPPPEAFRTHSNYLRAFARLVAPGAGTTDDALAIVAATVASFPAVGRTLAGKHGALNSLSIAWRTELLLDLTASALADDEFVKLANTWAVIQVYYVFYHCTQALAQAKGHPRAPSHPKTQNQFYDFWGARALLISPWTLAFGHSGYRNVPPSVQVQHPIHPWSTCDDLTCWSLAVMALRTTREDAVLDTLAQKRADGQRERRKAWDAKEAARVQHGLKAHKRPRFPKPQLTTEEKTQARQRVRPSTIMDYLFRLRIRTNYEDSAMFTDGPEVEGASLEVLHNLRRLSAATLLVHELTLAELLGRDTLLEQVTRFLDLTAPTGIVVSLRQRLALLQQHARNGV